MVMVWCGVEAVWRGALGCQSLRGYIHKQSHDLKFNKTGRLFMIKGTMHADGGGVVVAV